MASPDSYEVYFEAQDEETSLCGQHALNNLLQGAYFTAIDLGHIGAKLDEQEQNLLYSINEEEKMSEDVPSQYNANNNEYEPQGRDRKYSNVSMEGLFSIDVIIAALRSIKMDALPLSHPDCLSANTQPDKENGFIFYQMSHWLAYRKIHGVWYDLNSQSNYLLLKPQPVRISEFFLSAQLSKLQDEGFQVYVIRGQFPGLGRLAPKSQELKGQYFWYQSADIKAHVELDKESRIKVAEEQQRKTQQLMQTDPQQYAMLTGQQPMIHGGHMTYDEMPAPDDLYAVNGVPPEYQAFHAQQQYLAMQEYNKQTQESDTNGNGSNNGKENGVMSKLGNPFSKLKTYYNEKTQELKAKLKNNNNGNNNSNNGSNHNAPQSPDQFLSDLEKAKQESLRLAQQQQNQPPATRKNVSFNVNSPYIESPHNEANLDDDIDDDEPIGPYAQQIMVVGQNGMNPAGPPQLNTATTDEDVQLAMALSASVAANGGPPSGLPIPDNAPRPYPQNEPVELEYEMTDHKAKIIHPPPNSQLPHVQPQQNEDFLGLASIGSMSSMNENEDEEEKQETIDRPPPQPKVVVDANDPFASLIKQYSNGSPVEIAAPSKPEPVVATNHNGNVSLLDFTNQHHVNGNMVNTDILFPDNMKTNTSHFVPSKVQNDPMASNDILSSLMNGSGSGNDVNNSDPLLSLSPNYVTTSSGDSVASQTMYNKQAASSAAHAQRMEDDIWMMLEQTLSTDHNT